MHDIYEQHINASVNIGQGISHNITIDIKSRDYYYLKWIFVLNALGGKDCGIM